MADRDLYTNEAALAEAEVIRADLALSKMRLFDSTLVPTVTTTKVEMTAVETALVGYPAGGYTLTAWGAAMLVSGGGAAITSPLVAVAYASGATAALGGGWIEDAAGDVREVFIFDPPRTLAAVGDGFQWVRQLVYGRNPS